MKNNKGITLTSLVIYIALIFVITAIVMRVTIYFKNNMENVADTSFETEFQKINLYMIEESKRKDNEMLGITDGIKISFSSGNNYTYNRGDKKIYLNDTIKICENVEDCLFEEKTADNGKSIIALSITINETTKTAEYIISYPKTEQIVNELDYTWENIENEVTE